MVNYVLLSANVIVTMKLKFAAQLERMPMDVQSNQPVNQKEQTQDTNEPEADCLLTLRLHVFCEAECHSDHSCQD